MLNGLPLILYDNRFLDGLPVATDTAPGTDVLNITDCRDYTFHQFAAFGTKYYTVPCGSAKAADALALLGHNYGSAAAQVSIETSDDNFGTHVTQRLTPFAPANDKALFQLFNSASDPYWRMKVVTASEAARLAVAVLGSRLEVPRHPAKGFAPDAERIEGASSRSKKGGHLLGVVRSYVGRTISVTFNHVDPAWIKDTFQPVWDSWLSQLKPFFFVWDPVNHADEIYYVKIPDTFEKKFPYDRTTRTMTLTFEGVKEE